MTTPRYRNAPDSIGSFLLGGYGGYYGGDDPYDSYAAVPYGYGGGYGYSDGYGYSSGYCPPYGGSVAARFTAGRARDLVAFGSASHRSMVVKV